MLTFFREKWSNEEDIKLLSESLKTPKKWALISRKFDSRNCHQIKNRFICLLAKELDCKREEIRDLINENKIIGPVSKTLEKLSQNLSQNQSNQAENTSNNEEPCDKKNYQNRFEFEEFINCQQESPNFIFLS